MVNRIAQLLALGLGLGGPLLASAATTNFSFQGGGVNATSCQGNAAGLRSTECACGNAGSMLSSVISATPVTTAM